MPKKSESQTRESSGKKSKKESKIVDVENEADTAVSQNEDIRTLKCGEDEFDMERFRLQALNIEDMKETTQFMCFPRYLYKDKELTEKNLETKSFSPLFITESIKMAKGGIPRYNPKYHDGNENSNKRAYFYIPKIEKDKNSMDLFNDIQTMDDFMDEEINVKKNENAIVCYINKSGKKVPFKGLTYKRMITTAKQGGDNELLEDDEQLDTKKGNKNEKEFVPYDRIKAKFKTLYEKQTDFHDQSMTQKDLITSIYLGEKEEPEQDCTTVTGILKHFMWNCSAKFALMLNKFWIKKDDKTCGFGIVCIQINVTEQPDHSTVSTSRQLSKKLFATSGPMVITSYKKDEDEDNVSVKNSSKKGKLVKASGDSDDDNDDNDDNDDSDDDTSNKKKSTQKAKPSKPSKKVVESDEDNSDEDNNSDAEDNEDNSDVEDNSDAEEDVESSPESESDSDSEPKKSKKDLKVKGNEKKNVVKAKEVKKGKK